MHISIKTGKFHSSTITKIPIILCTCCNHVSILPLQKGSQWLHIKGSKVDADSLIIRSLMKSHLRDDLLNQRVFSFVVLSFLFQSV